MKFIFALLAISILIVTSCKKDNPVVSSLDPSQAPHVFRPYDSTIGGIQITTLFYDQDSNLKYGIGYNEEVVIQTDHEGFVTGLDTKGWTINAGAVTQTYPFPDTTFRTLQFMTHGAIDSSTKLYRYLGVSSGTWIWNNDHDTARVFDATEKLVSELGY